MDCKESVEIETDEVVVDYRAGPINPDTDMSAAKQGRSIPRSQRRGRTIGLAAADYPSTGKKWRSPA
jgi:hypothetical protein